MILVARVGCVGIVLLYQVLLAKMRISTRSKQQALKANRHSPVSAMANLARRGPQ